ncbi:hypothetical protein Fcan01_19402 [Folsomia candida]|uniref:Uncharacterized protein n=1 Tax=Folsomia candida TaxID=158441 RepID=A0A226DM04_FOLCA|nr:hypothetical protein Fcan01_19402 [Folsomia candida]
MPKKPFRVAPMALPRLMTIKEEEEEEEGGKPRGRPVFDWDPTKPLPPAEIQLKLDPNLTKVLPHEYGKSRLCSCCFLPLLGNQCRRLGWAGRRVSAYHQRRRPTPVPPFPLPIGTGRPKPPPRPPGHQEDDTAFALMTTEIHGLIDKMIAESEKDDDILEFNRLSREIDWLVTQMRPAPRVASPIPEDLNAIGVFVNAANAIFHKIMFLRAQGINQEVTKQCEQRMATGDEEVLKIVALDLIRILPNFSVRELMSSPNSPSNELTTGDQELKGNLYR